MLKKPLAFSIAILLFAFAFAADTTQAKKFSRWYAGVSFTPGVSYRLLTHNYYEAGEPPPGHTNEGVQKFIIDYRNKGERPGLSLALGFKAGVKVARFLSVETGLNYERVGYWSKIENLMFGSQWNGSSYDTTYSNYSIKLFDHYHYADIPVALSFSLGKGKLQAVINTGANFSFLIVKTHSSRSNLPGHTNYTEQVDKTKFNHFNISPFLGIGIEYHIYELMILRVMPVAQMQAMKNIDTPITEYLYSGGINMCLLFNLQKKK